MLKAQAVNSKRSIKSNGAPAPAEKKGVNISAVQVLGRNMEAGIFIEEIKMVRLANHSGFAKRSGLRNLKSKNIMTNSNKPKKMKMFFARLAGTIAMRKIPMITPIPEGINTNINNTGNNNK